MKQFKLVDILLGWLVFIIASFVYIKTAESSGSLWDCGEFLSGAIKLQVVHPPGAPLFLMLARIFSLFTSDPEKKGFVMNTISAISSGAAVMMVYWITTGLARRLMVKEGEEISLDKAIAMMGSGLVGALACTFMDTMWFSAVEGEVYAMSTFFIAIVVWGVMKWESSASETQSNRWLVFVAYMIGLSIGVHLLSLLVIPVAVLIYYLKKHKPTTKGILFSIFIGFVFLTIVNIGIIQYLTKIAGTVELFFVNTLHLPFNSGLAFTYLAFFAILIGIIWYAKKTQHPDLQLFGLCIMMIMLGFSSYAMVPIRSSANPPINMNAPKDAYSMLSYLNREQYGSRPTAYGPLYTAKPDKYIDKGKDYFKNTKTGRYEVKKIKKDLHYNSEDKMLFPRLWSSEDNHVRLYEYWANYKGTPTFGDNMTYFFKYQVGYMYWRYFFWNFAGRQDVLQGTADNKVKNGNWISGIPFIDNFKLGSQEGLPKAISENKGRNKYYLLPFLFGLLGYIYLVNKNKEWAIVYTLLFLMTGLLLVIYSNEPPVEPRERDYIYVGSYFVFCFFIGLGVASIIEFLKSKKVPGVVAALGVTLLSLVAVPYVMAKNGWDDHNRHGRYLARDFATDFLESCPPNAILFTQGDNDTYPLWYAQEVEGIRPDVRVANLSLLGVDWYIDFLRYASNKSAPLPFYKEFTPDKYMGDRRDYLQYLENQQVVNPNEYYDLQKVLSFMLSDKKDLMAVSQSGESVNYLPTTKLKLKINKEAVLKANYLPDSLKSRIVDEIQWDLGKQSIIKFDLAVLALIAGNDDWSRPICFANTCEPGYFQGLDKYMYQKGLVYQFVPVEFPQNQRGYTVMDLDYTNKLITGKFKYGGMDKHEMNMDENSQRLMINIKSVHFRLADELNRAGRKEESTKILEQVRAKFPYNNVPYYSPYSTYFNYYNMSWLDLYYRNGHPELAEKVYSLYIKDLADCMRFYNLPNSFAQEWSEEKTDGEKNIKQLESMAVFYKDDKLMTLLKQKFPGLITATLNTPIEGQPIGN